MSNSPSLKWLAGALALENGQTPFRWQERLLAGFLEAAPVTALDIPTGLGKTSVMGIWLVARAVGGNGARDDE